MVGGERAEGESRMMKNWKVIGLGIFISMATAPGDCPAPMSLSIVQAAETPHLGTLKTTLDRLWKRDPGYKRPCGLGICEYVTGGIRISVGFDAQTGTRASDFITYGYKSPGAHKYWAFLVGLVPRGAKKSTCKMIPKTGGANGPAYACMYRQGKHNILVAQYLRPTDPATSGETKMDATFDDIAAAY